jgi:hypothetical protein
LYYLWRSVVCRTFPGDWLNGWILVRTMNFIRASALRLNHLEC